MHPGVDRACSPGWGGGLSGVGYGVGTTTISARFVSLFSPAAPKELVVLHPSTSNDEPRESPPS